MFIPSYRSETAEQQSFPGFTAQNIFRNPVRRLISPLLFTAVLVLAGFTLLIILSGLMGFRLTTVRGESMEPNIRSGDVLWTREVPVDRLQPGDIVTLGGGTDYITHRLVSVEECSNGSFRIETRGDANASPEYWKIDRDGTALVMMLRIPIAGYLIEFAGTATGRIILITGMICLIFTVIRNQRYRKSAQAIQEV